jgi:putative hydrolase
MARFQELMGDPDVVLGAVRSSRQQEILPWLDALVSVIAGYVDRIMDEIGQGLVASYPQITEALRRRRVEASAQDRFVERLLGLELTPGHYERGAAFIAGVVDRAGRAALEQLWTSAEALPTPNELDAPGLWLARLDVPVVDAGDLDELASDIPDDLGDLDDLGGQA